MSASTFFETSVLNFEHIKYGERCHLTPHVITQMLQDSQIHADQSSFSSRLVRCLDDCHGTEEIVQNRRKVTIANDDIQNANEQLLNWFSGGSVGDGFRMKTSDSDAMHSMMTVLVTCPDHIQSLPPDSENKTILLMRNAGCRPGYASLEILQIGDEMGRIRCFRKAIVPVGESQFLSSDIYRQEKVEALSRAIGIEYVSNGPCSSVFSMGYGKSIDASDAFPCVCWPKEADEWTDRIRLYGWPSPTMIDKIIQGGCHLVPVGDKCSADTLLQWRISFACSERLLVHSLCHPQFRVYGLLKYFLSQIKDLLEHIIGDSDILCSYFIKTAIFYAVENSPHSLWDGHNTFTCFRFCLSILIAWVKSGYCPNYFIQANNMFLRKVHGENRQKLLHFLIDLYYLNWMGLCVESRNSPYVGRMLQEHPSINSRHHSEYLRDLDLFQECFFASSRGCREEKLYPLMQGFLVAKTDVDDFIAYYAIGETMCRVASNLFEENTTAGGNKEKYLALRRCEQLLVRQAEICTSPGLLLLATFYYRTENYMKAIELCAESMSTFKLFVGKSVIPSERSREQYERLYCGRGYTLLQKLKTGVYTSLKFSKFFYALCIPHLIPEATKHTVGVIIPPKPYATFLFFLCYHELGENRRRDRELLNLRALNHDPEQGGQRSWIVHTMLGICYQTVGDNRRAIRSFTDSVRRMPDYNPALERIAALQDSEQAC